MAQAAVVEELLALAPAVAAVAAHKLAVLWIEISLASVVSGLVEQRALPALAAVDIDVAKRPARRCIVLQGQCLTCFDLVTAQTAHISKKEGCLAPDRPAVVLARAVLAS